MSQEMIAERLAVYGLRELAKKRVRNLEVARGGRVFLGRRRPPPEVRLAKAEPKTVEEIKRMIGVPDTAVARPARPAITRLPTVTGVTVGTLGNRERAMFSNAVRGVVFGHSATLSRAARRALDALYTISPPPPLPVFVVADVLVGAEATLEIAPGSIFFANDITVERGGVIVVGDGCCVDCNSFTGL